MKKFFFLPVLLILGACSQQELEQDLINTLNYEVEIPGCINIEKKLGELGILEVTNDQDYIYVSVVANAPSKISQVRLAVLTSEAMASLNGTAINNMTKYDLDPAVSKKTFTFPLYTVIDGVSVKNYPDNNVNILARATIDGLAIWPEGTKFGNGSGQGYYFNYVIQTCVVEDDNDVCQSESAYMEGDIELNKHYTTPKNWGWAQYFDSSQGAVQTFPMYAGAGQNNANNEGVHVGDVSISWIQSTGAVEASVTLKAGYTLESYEVFVAESLPAKRPGPGQYTNSGDFNLDGKFYVIVHGNVCW